MKHVYTGILALSIISSGIGCAEHKNQYYLNRDLIFTPKGVSTITGSGAGGAYIGYKVSETLCDKDNIPCKALLSALGAGIGCLASILGVSLDTYTSDEKS